MKKLKNYLEDTKMLDETNNQRYTRFAKQLEVSLHTIRKWLSGERGIKDKYKRLIVIKTGGKVRVTDLMQR